MKKNKLSLISVLVITYNQDKYIEECIRSIFNQKYNNIEIVVMDDGSTDDTFKILNKLIKQSPFKMRAYTQVNKGFNGLTATFNKLISFAEGDFVAFIAGDDKFYDNRFESQFKIFNKNSSIKVVYGNGRFWDGENTSHRVMDDEKINILSYNSEKILNYLVTHISPFYIQSGLFKKDFLLDIGGFDESLIADDWVLNIRIFKKLSEKKWSFHYIDEDLFYYRRHNTNTSNDLKLHFNRIKQVILKYTPSEYRNKFLSDIYWEFGVSYFKQKNIFKAIMFFVNSQKLNFTPDKFFKSIFSFFNRINKKI